MSKAIAKAYSNHKSMTIALLLFLVVILSSVTVNGIASPNTQIYSITTPNGSFVNYAYLVTGEFNPTEIINANAYMDTTYPNAIRQRSATGKYNCHSYAWYSTSTSNNIWIGYNVYYISDGSYSLVAMGNRLTIPSQAPIGSKVDFSSDGHSAIKYSSSKLISKWGDYGLYIHSPNHCPYPSSTSLGYYN